MSDPSLVQITFKIKPAMPYDMKKLILALFTDYFNYYPEKADDEEICKISAKYPVIAKLYRNDAYHNVQQQVCQLDTFFLYDIDTEDRYEKVGCWLDDNGNDIPNPLPNIGVSIISLPRTPDIVEQFLELVAPYIDSETCTIGIQHYSDYGKIVAYYYIDDDGNIRKHMIRIDKNNDELISSAIDEAQEWVYLIKLLILFLGQ